MKNCYEVTPACSYSSTDRTALSETSDLTKIPAESTKLCYNISITYAFSYVLEMKMKYYDIKKQLDSLIVFSLQDLYLIDPNFRQATLYDWEKIGKVTKLRNNHYVFSDFAPKNYQYYLLSNLLYEPSYVSMELALNHYGVIPESVSTITAISTNKTKKMTNKYGAFSYQTVAPKLFFGYELLEVSGRKIKIASLEKAILDYLYLNSKIISTDDFESLRWNKQILREEVNKEKLKKYLDIFSNARPSNRVAIMKEYLES